MLTLICLLTLMHEPPKTTIKEDSVDQKEKAEKADIGLSKSKPRKNDPKTNRSDSKENKDPPPVVRRWQLVSIEKTLTGHRALMRESFTKKTLYVRVGDSLGEWIITSICNRWVVGEYKYDRKCKVHYGGL